jgi:predicted RNA-binding protein with PIN domain
VPDPTLYLFDGYNLLHAGGYDDPRELVDQLASFVAEAGARGIVVFDGHGTESAIGRLEIRYAEDADTLLERLAAEHRDREEVQLISSDSAVRGTSGGQVRKIASKDFLGELGAGGQTEFAPHRVSERIDDETRAKLERLRRGQGPEQED